MGVLEYEMRGNGRRGGLTAFIKAHNGRWEVAMGCLSLIYFCLSFLDDSHGIGWNDPLVLSLSALFALEFAARCWDNPDRWAYVHDHWIDLVSVIPFVGGLRVLRLLKLVKLLVPVKVLLDLAQTKLLRRDGTWFLLPSFLLLWFGSAYSIWVLEHGMNPHMRTFLDALYWSFITVTSLGYGSYPPVTAGGHLLAGLLVFVGVGVVGAASARLTSLWLAQDDHAAERKEEAWQAETSQEIHAVQSTTSHEIQQVQDSMVDEMGRLRKDLADLRSLLLLALNAPPASDDAPQARTA
ncbi:MAG TPA: ion channel [Chloroflexota bacterium]|nr:ion channel [Chloroflexota bacterium]